METLTTYADRTAAPVTSGAAIPFDANTAQNGTAITHTPGSEEITLTENGTYYVSFHGTLDSETAAGVATSAIFFTLDGIQQPGASSQHTFTTVGETAAQTIALLLTTTSAPQILRVVLQGGTFEVSNYTLNIYKIG